jgi:hypothetical protein
VLRVKRRAVLGFGWRSWEQRCRTGSTGFKGISGRLGSTEWFAGVGFVAALAAAVLAPVLQLITGGRPARTVDPDHRNRDLLTVQGAGTTPA